MPKISKEVQAELCSLLSAVSGLLEQLMAGQFTEKQKHQSEEILKAVVKMRTLLNGSLKDSGKRTSNDD